MNQRQNAEKGSQSPGQPMQSQERTLLLENQLVCPYGELVLLKSCTAQLLPGNMVKRAKWVGKWVLEGSPWRRAAQHFPVDSQVQAKNIGALAG